MPSGDRSGGAILRSEWSFPHNPEPLPEYLGTIAQEVKLPEGRSRHSGGSDVDRLALGAKTVKCSEKNTPCCGGRLCTPTPEGTNSFNLSSTQALGDVAEKHGVKHYQAAVGEVNVVTRMKAVGSVIGGEGTAVSFCRNCTMAAMRWWE